MRGKWDPGECKRKRGGRDRGRRVCMCALLTTTPVVPFVHSAVWGLNVHVCVCVFACIHVCTFLPKCLPKCFPMCVLQPRHLCIFPSMLVCVCVWVPGLCSQHKQVSVCQHMCCMASPYITSCQGSTVERLEGLPRLPSQHREQSEALFNPAECTSHI